MPDIEFCPCACHGTLIRSNNKVEGGMCAECSTKHGATAIASAMPTTINQANVQFYAKFEADPVANNSQDIPIHGILVRQNQGANVNKWRIGKRGAELGEFQNIAAQVNNLKVMNEPTTVRLQHVNSPEKVVGEWYKAVASEDNGEQFLICNGVIRPEDAQIRTNIQRNWLRYLSIGLKGDAFCDACDKQLTVIAQAEGEQLQFNCEHVESIIYFKNCTMKEGSIVTDPAFPGSQFKIGIGAGMEQILPKITSIPTRNFVDFNTGQIPSSLNSSEGNHASVNIMPEQATVEAKASGKAKDKEEMEAANPFDPKALTMADWDAAFKYAGKSAYGKGMMKAYAGEDEEEKKEEDGQAQGKAYSNPNLGDSGQTKNDLETGPKKEGWGKAESESEGDGKAKANAHGDGCACPKCASAEGSGKADAKEGGRPLVQKSTVPEKTMNPNRSALADALTQRFSVSASANDAIVDMVKMYRKAEQGYRSSSES